MFGYIKPFKPEMKIKEFDTYKAIYCGLCKQLGTEYGQWARFTLSYDFTLVSVLSLALTNQKCEFKAETCIANPLKKKPCMKSCADLSFSSAVAMIMVYYKLKDNYQDGNFWDKLKVVALLPFAKSARKKAMKKYSYLDNVISKCMTEQAKIEGENSSSVDRAADPTAKALSQVFEYLSDDESQKRILSRLGYLLGRYVYFIDALDDIEDDIKNQNYNVFASKANQLDADPFFSDEKISTDEKDETDKIKQVKEYAKGVINLSVGEIAATYELLDLKRYKTILDNIFYLGLHDSLDKVVKGVKIEKEK